MTMINTNVTSINAQRNLMSSQTSLSTAVQRLSSGLRINSAKDDAAGLAISERFTTQIRGLNQAIRNANDGISLAQTAEGALGSISNNLQRIRELAVQSRNATNSADDRAALQKEVEQLRAEVQRVATQTQFNGLNLLDGSFTAQEFQVGANQGQTILVSGIANAQIDQLGSWTSVDSQSFTQTTSAVQLTDPEQAASVQINGVTISVASQATRNAADATAAFVAAFEAAKALPANTGLANVTIDNTGAITSTDPQLVIAGSTNLNLTNGTTPGTATTVPGGPQTGFQNIDISNESGADNAILAMDAALNAINDARADLGAIQNRFITTVSNLSVTAENLTASRSRILDADFAQETAALSRAQILQQAGVAMVAQANQVPQGVLQLLGR